MIRLALFAFAASVAISAGTHLSAQDARRVEVVVVRGVIDASVEAAVLGALEDAERGSSAAVVLEIDSRGSLGVDSVVRMADAIRSSAVPVISWIGPPGAVAQNAAAALVQAAHLRAMSPGSVLGPMLTPDLRARRDRPEEARRLAGDRAPAIGARTVLSADAAQTAEVVEVVALQLHDLLSEVDGRTVATAGGDHTIESDPSSVAIRFRKGSIPGRALHATLQPSMAYLLLLLGLVGVVFELFHPSTGPAGLSGLLSLALAGHGLYVMDASWLGVALVVAGIAGLGVDLRYQSLGPFTLLGAVGLAAGSALMFPAPHLRAHPVVLVLGVLGMVAFMLGAMTKVMRDLRAVAAGEREVVDPVEELHRQVSGTIPADERGE